MTEVLKAFYVMTVIKFELFDKTKTSRIFVFILKYINADFAVAFLLKRSIEVFFIKKSKAKIFNFSKTLTGLTF